MNEIYSQFSKAKANRSGKSPRFSAEAPALSHESLSAMPLRFTPDTTWLTKPKPEPIKETASRTSEHGLRTALFGDTLRIASAPDGVLSLSLAGSGSDTRVTPSAMKLSTNGSTKKRGILSGPWFSRTAGATRAGTLIGTKTCMFQREFPFKHAPHMFRSATKSATGRLTP